MPSTMQPLVETHDYDPIKDDRIRAFAQPKPVARNDMSRVGKSERAVPSTSYLPTLASVSLGVADQDPQTPSSTSPSSAVDMGSKTSLPTTTTTTPAKQSLSGLFKLLIPLTLACALASIDNDNHLASGSPETPPQLGSLQSDFIRSSYWISYTVLSFPFTIMAGIVSKHRMFPVLFFLLGIGNLCLAFSSHFVQLMVVESLLGVASAGVLPALLLSLIQGFKSVKHTGLALALIIIMGRTIAGLLHVLEPAMKPQSTSLIVQGGIALLSVAGSYLLLAPGSQAGLTESEPKSPNQIQILVNNNRRKTAAWKTILLAANKPLVVVTGTLILPTNSMVSLMLVSTEALSPTIWKGLILVLAPAAFLVLLSIVAFKMLRLQMVLILVSALLQLLGTVLFICSFGHDNQAMRDVGAIVGCIGGAPIIPLSLAYLLGLSNDVKEEQDQLWWKVGAIGPAFTGIGLGRIVHIWAPHLSKVLQVVGILITTSLGVAAITFWTIFEHRQLRRRERTSNSDNLAIESANSTHSEPKSGPDSVTIGDTSTVTPPTPTQHQIA